MKTECSNAKINNRLSTQRSTFHQAQERKHKKRSPASLKRRDLNERVRGGKFHIEREDC